MPGATVGRQPSVPRISPCLCIAVTLLRRRPACQATQAIPPATIPNVVGSGTAATVVSSTPLNGTPLNDPPFRVNVTTAVEEAGWNDIDVTPKSASVLVPERFVTVPSVEARTVPLDRLGCSSAPTFPAGT